MHTLVFATWTDIPAHIRPDCMERIAPGVHRHLRLGITFVCLNEANTTEGVTTLMHDWLDARGSIPKSARQGGNDPCSYDERHLGLLAINDTRVDTNTLFSRKGFAPRAPVM